MSEFAWWFLIVGMVVGAALAWLVLADSTRREVDESERELPMEAAWISDALAERGTVVDDAAVEEVLRLHREYLGVPPPDNAPHDAESEEPAVEPEAPAEREPAAEATGSAGAAANENRGADTARG